MKLHWPFEGNREADVAPGENGFDTPELESVRSNGESENGPTPKECWAKSKGKL